MQSTKPQTVFYIEQDRTDAFNVHRTEISRVGKGATNKALYLTDGTKMSVPASNFFFTAGADAFAEATRRNKKRRMQLKEELRGVEEALKRLKKKQGYVKVPQTGTQIKIDKRHI